jgi:hypothetical protein
VRDRLLWVIIDVVLVLITAKPRYGPNIGAVDDERKDFVRLPAMLGKYGVVSIGKSK